MSDVKLNKEALFYTCKYKKDNAAVKVTCLFKVVKGLLFPDQISRIVMVKKVCIKAKGQQDISQRSRFQLVSWLHLCFFI